MPSLTPQTLLRRFVASGASDAEQKALAKALGLVPQPPRPKRSKVGKPPINGEPMVVKTITVSLPPAIAEWIDTQPNKSAIARAGIEEQYKKAQNS